MKSVIPLGIILFTWYSKISADFTFPFLCIRKNALVKEEHIKYPDQDINLISLNFEKKIKDKISKLCVKESLTMLKAFKSKSLNGKTSSEEKIFSLEDKARWVSSMLKHTLDRLGTIGNEILIELKKAYNVDETYN